jgi:DNA-binding MarR family transcriptional regulator
MKRDQLAIGTWIRFLKAHNLILREARKRLNGSCTMSQFDILAQLDRSREPLTLAELSRTLLVTAGNITGMIDRMEEAGWVERKPDPQDRRATRVQSTPKGKQLAKSVIPKHARDIENLFASLNDQEITQLRNLLEKLVTRLEQ